MLFQYGADPNIKGDRDELTPLHVAATTDSVVAAQVLLKHGTEVDMVDKLGATPLAKASSCGNLPMVQLLIENGASVNTKNKTRETPLVLAVKLLRYGECKSTALVEPLLDHGSCVNATDLYGRSAIRTSKCQKRIL